MHFKFRNVNDAFHKMVYGFHALAGGGKLAEPTGWDVTPIRSTSRNGDVLYIQEPIIITYTHPRERVLFNQARDANPFFHLYEALWMLSGRNDVGPLAYYNSNIANYSDDDKVFNGAYGYRWRHAKDYTYDDPYPHWHDQLRILIDHLKSVPDSRRAVLSMWNVADDLLKIGPENQSKDVCCNLSAKFSIREESHSSNGSNAAAWLPNKKYLDMTVDNRSNDLIWGLLGANAVHFSFLQEYMAACIGVEIGVYNQITNNCHCYMNDKWQPEKWLADDTPDEYRFRPDYLCPLVKDPATFNREVVEFVERHRQDAVAAPYTEPFLFWVAQPMCIAFHWHKHRNYSAALATIETVQADDWRIAGKAWLLKRKEGYEARTK